MSSGAGLIGLHVEEGEIRRRCVRRRRELREADCPARARACRAERRRSRARAPRRESGCRAIDVRDAVADDESPRQAVASRRASRAHSIAASQVAPIAAPIPTLIHSPTFALSARAMHTATTLAASTTAATSRSGSRHGERDGTRRTASSSRRSTCSGATLRTPSTGPSAKSTPTHVPSASPLSAGIHSRRGTTSTGMKLPSTCGSTNCAATPSTTPSTAPASPSPAASITNIHTTWRALAPRQRSTAIASIFSAMYARSALATPVPPSRSAMRPTRPRNRPSCSIDRRERALGVGDGSRAHLQRVEHLAVRLRDARPHRASRGASPAPRSSARLPKREQLRRVEIAIGDVDARAERGRDADVAGHVAQRGDDRKARVAERERVADLRVERDEERGVDDRVRSGSAAPSTCRRATSRSLRSTARRGPSRAPARAACPCRRPRACRRAPWRRRS